MCDSVKARRFPRFAALLTCLCAMAAIPVGCTEVSAPAPAAAMQAAVEVMFNPQPDPPMEMLYFSIDNPNLLIDPRGEIGRLHGVDGGDIGRIGLVGALPPRIAGQVVHLEQQWEFITDGTSLPAVKVAGILNMATGVLVLNGVASDGRRVHVRGGMDNSLGSLLGQVMFNPQPDPPLDF